MPGVWRPKRFATVFWRLPGKLDRTEGGDTLPTHSLETFLPNLTTFNPSGVIKTARLPENLRYRRTVYLPIFRTKQMKELDILNYFDFAEPTQINASRRTTVVPTQSLFLHEFALDCRTGGSPGYEADPR